MELKDVNTWDEYEEYVKSQGPEWAAVVDKCTRIAHATCVAIDALKEIHMGMCIYDLDEMPEDTEGEIEEEEAEEPEHVLTAV